MKISKSQPILILFFKGFYTDSDRKKNTMFPSTPRKIQRNCHPPNFFSPGRIYLPPNLQLLFTYNSWKYLHFWERFSSHLPLKATELTEEKSYALAHEEKRWKNIKLLRRHKNVHNRIRNFLLIAHAQKTPTNYSKIMEMLIRILNI